ncbi:MAG: polysaccharide export protein [bacterium]|nr:polysaccharide export protein [bacterium]
MKFKKTIFYITVLLIISVVNCSYGAPGTALAQDSTLSGGNQFLYPGAAKQKMILANLEQTQNSTAAETYNDPNKTIATEVGTSDAGRELQLIGDSFGSTITDAMRKKYLSGYENLLPVFGENLFARKLKLPLISLHNPEYLISIGDKIAITIWGELEVAQQFTVDSQGNIFLPKVGPIHVAGLQNKELNQIISSAISSVFKDNVHIYANLVTAQPIKVFVSGYVVMPGLYAGISSNSILYFLSNAGGIILNQGSFRDIKVIRNGKLIQRVDLYNFLKNGTLPYVQLQQRDSIVVGPTMGSIDVSGKVFRSASYEPGKKGILLKDLLSLGGTTADATYALIEDNKGHLPKQSYINLKDVKDQIIYSGEEVTLISDQNANFVRASISGAASTPHHIVVPRGTTLDEVMNKYVKLKPEANVAATQLFRKKLAIQQKAAIMSNLLNFERDAYTSNVLTAEGALIQTKFADLVTQFVNKVKQVEPKGQLVIYSPDEWKSIHIENEDVINIPYKTQVVRVDGCVLTPTALIIKNDFDLGDYIRAAGGYTNMADTANIIIASQNGRIYNTSLAWYNFWSSVPDLKPGDHVMVLPGTSTQGLTVLTALAQVVYQVAISARMVTLF